MLRIGRAGKRVVFDFEAGSKKTWSMLELADLMLTDKELEAAPEEERRDWLQFRHDARYCVQYYKRTGFQPSLIARRTGLALRTVQKYY